MLTDLTFDFENSEHVKDGSLTYHREGKTHILMTVPEHAMWISMGDKKPVCVFHMRKIEDGIYQGGLNFEHDIGYYTDFTCLNAYDRLGKDGLPQPFISFSDNPNYYDNTKEAYGVADNLEQIKIHFKDIIESDANIVICVSEIRKDSEPSDGGWRWHKWGPYIGKQNPQYEYLYNEPEIESVYVYHVYSIVPKNTLEQKVKNKIKA